jgi:hypothetical protein
VLIAVLDHPAWQAVLGAVLFLPLGAAGLWACFTKRLVIVIDDHGIRSGVFGWDVRWDEVAHAWVSRRRYHGLIALTTLVFAVRDPAAVIRRLPAKRRKGRRAKRLRGAIEHDGVRFALQYLDTPQDEITAAVARHVPVAR